MAYGEGGIYPERVLVAELGELENDRPHAIARTFRDAGYEVVYMAEREAVEEVVTAAVQEDPQILYMLSSDEMLKRAHLTEAMLEADDAGDIRVMLEDPGVWTDLGQSVRNVVNPEVSAGDVVRYLDRDVDWEELSFMGEKLPRILGFDALVPGEAEFEEVQKSLQKHYELPQANALAKNIKHRNPDFFE